MISHCDNITMNLKQKTLVYLYLKDKIKGKCS